MSSCRACNQKVLSIYLSPALRQFGVLYGTGLPHVHAKGSFIGPFGESRKEMCQISEESLDTDDDEQADPVWFISIPSFCTLFKPMHGSNRICDGPTCGPRSILWQYPPQPFGVRSLAWKQKNLGPIGGMFSARKKVANLLLMTYAAHAVIVDPEVEMQNFKQPSSIMPNQYFRTLWSEDLRCYHVYTEYSLKEIFPESLQKFIGNRKHSYYS